MNAARRTNQAVDNAENAAIRAAAPAAESTALGRRKVLVVDDSIMLLNFVQEILTEANYEIVAAANASDGLQAAEAQSPELILLDNVLPDITGTEVLRRLSENPATAEIPILYLLGFGTDLPTDPAQNPKVIGSLKKPFTSELLLQAVQTYMPQLTAESRADAPRPPPSEGGSNRIENASKPAPVPAQPSEEPDDAWWSAASSATPSSEAGVSSSEVGFESTPPDAAPEFHSSATNIPAASNGAFFCGDTTFFSLNRALHTIASEKLTGTLRASWNREPVEVLARDGQILLVTTRDPELYCPDAPNTLADIDDEKTHAAREQQRTTGQPWFLTLAQEELINREPAVQLVQHYGQKLFAQLWCAPRVRFMFERSEQLPDYSENLPAGEDVDHWTMGALRFIQSDDLDGGTDYDPTSIPAFTRDGFERVQRLRLTVAEAQFASQFNGARSVAQIARNLRLDPKLARLDLFRFLALEIVECWPSAAGGAKQERRGVFGRIFGG